MKGRLLPTIGITLLVAAGSVAAWGAQASATQRKPESEGSPPERQPPARSRSLAIKEVLPANVRISVTVDGTPLRSASGVVLAIRGSGDEKKGYVMTNAHVAALPEGKDATVEVLVDRKGETRRFPGKVIALGQVPDFDLAVIEVPGLEAGAASLVADADVELGDDVIAIGAPYGKGLSVSSGIVSQLGLDDAGAAMEFKTDAPIGYGTSGGGIFRVSDGKLVALVEGYRTVKVSFPVAEQSYSFDVPMPGETFAAPAAKIRTFLRAQDLDWLGGPSSVARRP